MEQNLISKGNQQNLFNDLRQIIEGARVRMDSAANYELTMMYWHIGNRINREILDNKRAAYGKGIVSQVATQLQRDYGGSGFELRNIRRMMQSASQIRDEQMRGVNRKETCCAEIQLVRDTHEFKLEGYGMEDV